MLIRAKSCSLESLKTQFLSNSPTCRWITDKIYLFKPIAVIGQGTIERVTWAMTQILPHVTHEFYAGSHGPLARYAKLRVAHALGMKGTFATTPRVSDPGMHHGTTGSLTSGFIWNWWRGKLSRYSRRMRNPQYYVSGKRPMLLNSCICRGIWFGS